MARFTGTTIEFPEIAGLVKQLRQFPSNIAAKHLGSALRKASKPAQQALKAEVRANQKGPTGNLLRAVTTKVVTYKKSGNAVALVGFTKAGTGKSQATKGSVRKGKDRAFHAGWLEFGTRPRKTKKKSIASSYNKLGPFTLAKVAKRGKYAGQVRVNTKPKYPKAFFKKAPDLRMVYLGRTQPEAPIKTAWRKSQGSVRSAMQAGMAIAVEKAGKDLANNFPPKRGGGIGPTPF